MKPGLVLMLAAAGVVGALQGAPPSRPLISFDSHPLSALPARRSEAEEVLELASPLTRPPRNRAQRRQQARERKVARRIYVRAGLPVPDHLR